MRKEFDEALCARFPKLYRDRHGDMTQTCMVWGFDCGDGWFQILWNLGLQLEAVSPETAAAQVKEKFGTLRFYTWDGNALGDRVVELAEHLSSKVCERCGGPDTIVGPLKPGGWWIENACQPCREKRESHVSD
jgi:hypothetical protein